VRPRRRVELRKRNLPVDGEGRVVWFPKSSMDATHPPPEHLRGYEIRVITTYDDTRPSSNQTIDARFFHKGDRFSFQRVIPEKKK
jgi:hypothetical protein